MTRTRFSFWRLFTTFALGFLLGAAGLAAVIPVPLAHAASATAATTPLSSPALGIPTTGFAPVVKHALPAVVNISSSKVVRTGPGPMEPFLQDPFFRRFFGDQFGPMFQGPRQEREQSLGSGVLVSSDGYILTNNHVVDGASEIKVSLSDKREFTAHVIGTDPKTDLALLKIDAKDLPALALGDSSRVQVGDVVLAIGNPFGLGGTVTMGIVSATGRGNLGIEDYENFIQTDAAINPGNSGGALIGSDGSLIGINTAILSRSGGNQGIGFAIPSSMAAQVMESLKKTGHVIRGWLGVGIQEVSPAIAKSFGLTETTGVLIREVTPNSPAAHAGLQRGDIILELNGQKVTDPRTLSLQVAQLAPHSTAHLRIFRQGSQQEVAVTLGEMPSGEQAQAGGGNSQEALQGLSVDELTPEIKQELQLPANTQGVVITGVDPSSQAAAAGLRRGDVVQEVNHKPIRNLREFDQVLQTLGQQPALLLINRGGNNFYVVVATQ
jgi:serine protease Do